MLAARSASLLCRAAWRLKSKRSSRSSRSAHLARWKNDGRARGGASRDRFGERHVADAVGKACEFYRPAVANRRDEVGFNVPAAEFFRRHGNFFQLTLADAAA